MFLVSADKIAVYLLILLNHIALVCLFYLSYLIWNGPNQGGVVGWMGGRIGIALKEGRSARG